MNDKVLPVNKDIRITKDSDEKAQLIVPGMGSNHCAGLVRTSIERLPGIEDIKTNIASHQVDVSFEPSQSSLEKIRLAVENAGYDVASAQLLSGSAIKKITLTVPGMGSNHCAGLVRTSLERLSGITAIETNIAHHQVSVSFDPEETNSSILRETVEKAGYDVASVESSASDSHKVAEAAEEQYLDQAWKNLWFAAIPTTLIMLLMIPEMFWQPIPGYLVIVAVLAFPVVFFKGGRSTHRSAGRSLKNRTANMDVLISLGSMPPYLIGLIGFVYPMTSLLEFNNQRASWNLFSIRR